VLTFEDLDKSTMAHVFFRIVNLKDNYPNHKFQPTLTGQPYQT